MHRSLEHLYANDLPLGFIRCSATHGAGANSLYWTGFARARNQSLRSFYWRHSDLGWSHELGYQRRINLECRASQPDVVAAVSVFGERIGDCVGSNDSLPDDFELPPTVHWKGRNSNACIPLTGTLFEYLDRLSANETLQRQGHPAVPTLVYFVGHEQDICAQERNPVDRGFGGRRWEARIEAETKGSHKRSALKAYDEQIEQLARFFDTFILSRRRGSEVHRPITFIEDPANFATMLERDLSRLLNLQRSYGVAKIAKGLTSYAPDDHGFFLGRHDESCKQVAPTQYMTHLSTSCLAQESASLDARPVTNVTIFLPVRVDAAP
jgi:hypothetical protein